MEIHPTAAEIAEAIYRIALTPDGAALYVLLQRRLMTVSTSPKSGALKQENGERIFASKLIDLMKQGIYESGGRTGSNSPSGTGSDREQPLVVPGHEPRSVGGPRASRRRVGADTIVPGWNDQPHD